MNKKEIINLSSLSKKYNGILIKTEEQMREALNDNKISLLAIAPKDGSFPVDKMPAWFLEFNKSQNQTNNVIIQKLNNIEVRLNKVEQRLDGVEQRLDGVEQRLDGVEQRLGNVEQRLDGVEQRLDGVEQRLDGVEQRLDGVEHRIDNLVKKNNLKE